MHSCFLRGILIRQQFRLNKGYLSSYCSTTGGVRAVHVSTAKFIYIYAYTYVLVLCTSQNEDNKQKSQKNMKLLQVAAFSEPHAHAIFEHDTLALYLSLDYNLQQPNIIAWNSSIALPLFTVLQYPQRC